MVRKTLLEEHRIEETIRRIVSSEFTVLDFIDVFKDLYPADWARLVERFGQLGEKRRYTVTTYLSNRLEPYSRKSGALLQPFTPYSKDRSTDYRRPTAEERERFGSPWIALFKKRPAEGERAGSPAEDRERQER